MEKVVTTLLVQHAGYAPEEILYGGLVSVDMSGHGGNANILDLKKIQQLSYRDARGPFDIVMVGGEIANADHQCGVSMLPKEQQKSATQHKIFECAYAIPKDLLVPWNYRGLGNLGVLNSVGGRPEDGSSCRSAFDSADYKSHRDTLNGNSHVVPDSAVMVKKLYGDVVSNLTLFPGVAHIVQKYGSYVAVQHQYQQQFEGDWMIDIAHLFDDVAEMTSGVIVFFCAGTAPDHDSFSFYQDIAKHMKKPSVVFMEENAFSVVSLIANSQATLGTSLHVRIMAFIFQIPRITWCATHKHRTFAEMWDAGSVPGHPSCSDYTTTLQDLRMSIDGGAHLLAVENVTEKYMDSFFAWSNLLTSGSRVCIGHNGTDPM